MGGSSQRSGSGMKWAKPIAKAAAGDVTGVFQANQPQTQNLANMAYGQAAPLWSRFNQGNEQVGQAQGYASDVLSGKYMQGNPYLDAVLSKTRGNITDQVNSEFAKAGRYGSPQYTQVLADSLFDAENAARMQDYNTQQGRMDQIAALAPTLAQAEYIGLPEALQTSQTAAELPYVGTTNYANALSALFNGGVQKQSGVGSILGGLGSLGSAVGSMGQAGMFSDRRLKSNIVKLGEFEDGLGIYEYDIFDRRERGVMAQEVEKLRPWALGPEVNGFKTVLYGEL
jgi:hypothetical protein